MILKGLDLINKIEFVYTTYKYFIIFNFKQQCEYIDMHIRSFFSEIHSNFFLRFKISRLMLMW